jgi:hypothetical protein
MSTHDKLALANVSLKAPVDLTERFRKLAREQGRSMSSEIRLLMAERVALYDLRTGNGRRRDA